MRYYLLGIITLLAWTIVLQDKHYKAQGGASVAPQAVEVPRQPDARPTRRMRVTAYCSCIKCCGAWSDGVTACGYTIQPGDRFAACDPSVPFKAVLTIPGYGTVLCLDRGGAIKGDRIDVYFDTHQEALNWGVKYVDVHILK